MGNSTLQLDDLQNLFDNQSGGQPESQLDIGYYVNLVLRRRWFVIIPLFLALIAGIYPGRCASQEISGRNPDLDRTPESAGQLCAGHRVERSRIPHRHHQGNDLEPDQPAQDYRKFQHLQRAQICRHVPGR